VVTLLMVLPMIFSIILMASSAQWARTVNRFLPTTAGEQIYQVGPLGGMSGGLGDPLAPWPGYFVLLGYALLAFIAALIVLRRRDA